MTDRKTISTHNPLRLFTDWMDGFWVGKGLDQADLASVSWRPFVYLATVLMPMIGVIPLIGFLLNTMGPVIGGLSAHEVLAPVTGG